MTSEPKRQLAAIMFTDMVGYAAMMQKDEDKDNSILIDAVKRLESLKRES